MRKLFVAGCAAAGLVIAVPAASQTFPTKPLRIVVAFMAFLRQDMQRWAKIARAANLRIE